MTAGIVAKVLSNDAGRKRVEVLLAEAKETARRLLAEHRHMVEALVASLLERNELVGDEITDVLERADRQAPQKPVSRHPEAVEAAREGASTHR